MTGFPFGRNRVKPRSPGGGAEPPPPEPPLDPSLVDWIYFVDWNAQNVAAGGLQGTVDGSPGGTGGNDVRYVDSGNFLSVGDDRVLTISGAVGTADPRIELLPSIARASGLAFYTRVMPTASNLINWLGWDTNQTSSMSEAASRINNGTELRMFGGVATELPGFTSALRLNEWFELAIILRSTGFWFYIRGTDLYPVWTLLWVDEVRGVSTPLFSGLSMFSGTCKVGCMGVTQLGAPYTTLHGPAEESSSSNGGNLSLGKGDMLVTAAWTPSADSQEFTYYARRVDDSNNIEIVYNCGLRGTANSGTIRVYRRVAAVRTELGTAQTWTSAAAGLANQVVAILDDDTIRTVAQTALAGQAVKHNITGEDYNRVEFRVKAFWSGTATFAQYSLRA